MTRKQQVALMAANGIWHPEWSAGLIIQNIHRTLGIKVNVIRFFYFDLFYDFAEVPKNGEENGNWVKSVNKILLKKAWRREETVQQKSRRS